MQLFRLFKKLYMVSMHNKISRIQIVYQYIWGRLILLFIVLFGYVLALLALYDVPDSKIHTFGAAGNQ